MYRLYIDNHQTIHLHVSVIGWVFIFFFLGAIRGNNLSRFDVRKEIREELDRRHIR